MNTSVHSKYLVKGDGHMCNITNTHNCEVCGCEVNDKEVLAVNELYHGRNSKRCLCKKHLRRMLSISEKKWNELINELRG